MNKERIKKPVPEKIVRSNKVQTASTICYKYSLLTLLGVTRALSRVDYHLPTKWYSMIDSVRASSSILHNKMSAIDEDIEEEFRRKEDMFDRRLGNKKFYNEDDVKELQKKAEKLQI